jgi:hypothetical protein|tara:strand:- start:1437 stop:4103 length:2667 start_codon:yes stop_codon:yes gene_type:complete
MPSGTQGYQSAGEGPLDKKVQEAINSIGNGGNEEKAKISVVTPKDKFMITGVKQDLGSAFSPGGDLVTSNEDLVSGPPARVIDVLWTVVDSIESQTTLIAGQTRLLAASVDMQADALAETKRLRREQRLEKTEDFSGTLKPIRDSKSGGKSGNALWDMVHLLGDAVRALKWTSRLGNMLPPARTLNALPPAGGVPRNVAQGVNPTNRLIGSADDVADLSKRQKILNIIENSSNPGEVAAAQNRLKHLDSLKNADLGVKPKTSWMDNILKPLKNFENPLKGFDMPKMPDLGIAKILNNPGVSKAIPLLSAVTGTMSLSEGDLAGAAVDYTDAAVDMAGIGATATGTASAAGGAGGIMGILGPAMSVIGTGLASSYVGEMTRGMGDWIRGDGTNQAQNVLGSLTDGLSGALEIVGTPFRALYEGANSLIKTGGFDESNKVMAEVDANIRESGRKFLNQFDFLNIVPDEVGGFGALGLYGDHADSAVEKLQSGDRSGSSVTDNLNAEQNQESPIKNAEGGSYIVDNPMITRGLMGGEAGKELVTFTPLGKSFRGGLHDALASAIEVPMKAAGGGIMAMAAKMPEFLGPLGSMVKPGIMKLLQPLANIFEMPNMRPSGGSSLQGIEQVKGHFENMFGGLTTGIQSLAERFLPASLRNMLPIGQPETPPAQTAPAATEAPSQGIEGEMYAYMTKELGLSHNKALGILANIQRESNFDVDARSGDDGGAGGLFQWYDTRQKGMTDAVPDWENNWKGQIRYAIGEDAGPEFQQQQFNSPQEAADWWMKHWERPADLEGGSQKHSDYLNNLMLPPIRTEHVIIAPDMLSPPPITPGSVLSKNVTETPNTNIITIPQQQAAAPVQQAGPPISPSFRQPLVDENADPFKQIHLYSLST